MTTRLRGTKTRMATAPWQAHVVTTDAVGARGVYIADIDSDGDMDRKRIYKDDKVAWYENTKRRLGMQAHVVTTNADWAHSPWQILTAMGHGHRQCLQATKRLRGSRTPTATALTSTRGDDGRNGATDVILQTSTVMGHGPRERVCT